MTEDKELARRGAFAMNAQALAFLGDGVYSLMAREYMIKAAGAKARDLHSRSTAMVNASAQAKGYEAIREMLSEDEADVFRRARNAHTAHTPKNASERDYHMATGVEALFGYLYLCGRQDRLRELFDRIIYATGGEELHD